VKDTRLFISHQPQRVSALCLTLFHLFSGPCAFLGCNLLRAAHINHWTTRLCMSKTGQHMDVNLLITNMDCAWKWYVKVLTSGGYAITSLKALARNNQGSTQDWGAAIPILRDFFGRQEGRQACVHQVIFTSRSVVPVEVVQYARGQRSFPLSDSISCRYGGMPLSEMVRTRSRG